MIGIIIVLFTLILTVLEKPQILKRPYKLEKKIFLALLFATAIFSSYKEFTNDAAQTKANTIIDSLQSKTIILRELLDSSRVENKTAHIESMDSLARYQYNLTDLLAHYKLKVDTFQNKIREISKSAKELPPTLTIFSPPKFDSLKNEIIISYNLHSLNADSHLLDYIYTIINIKKERDSLSFWGVPIVYPGTSNFTTILPANKDYPLNFFIQRIKARDTVTNTFYIAMEFWYKSKGNKRQTPLRKVYRLDYNLKKVSDTNSDEFMRVAYFLKKYKVWEKFYDL